MIAREKRSIFISSPLTFIFFLSFSTLSVPWHFFSRLYFCNAMFSGMIVQVVESSKILVEGDILDLRFEGRYPNVVLWFRDCLSCRFKRWDC